MLDYNDVRTRISDILEVGDQVKASAKILELNDLVTQNEAEDKAELERLNTTINEQTNKIKDLETEVSECRSANADIMLKYGQLLQHQPQQIIVEKKPEQDDDEKVMSWEDISKMD